MNYASLVIVVVVLLGAMTLTRRNRQRAVTRAEDEREKIGFGTDVMTTSGLYGTVVGLNDDDTVQLAIAPGVEVKWAMAALRDVASLPKKQRQDATPPDDSPPDTAQP